MTALPSQFQEYPKMLYRQGKMIEYEGQMLDHMTVNNRSEEVAAKGWFDHPSKVARSIRRNALLMTPLLFMARHWQFWITTAVALAAIYVSWLALK